MARPRFLSTLAELEVAERARRRIERYLLDACLPLDKALDGFAFAHVPMLSRGKNLPLFGPPGSSKTHISAAIGRTLVENGYRALFTQTTDLVQRLQNARQDLTLEAALTKLDRLVHHSVVVEMNVESYRQRAATTCKGRTAAKLVRPENEPTVDDQT